DDDGSVRRDRARGLLLLAQVGEQVLRGALVKRVLVGQPLDRPLVVEADELPRGAPDCLAELERAADPLALPEGNKAGDARGRRDEDAVTGDLLDPPRRGAQQECLA